MPTRVPLPRTRPLLVSAAALLSLGALGACSLEEPVAEKATTGAQSPSGKAADTTADGDGSKGGRKAAGPHSAGQSAVYADKGLKVTVSAPSAFTPSAYAAGHKSGRSAYKLRVTLENTGDARIDTTLVTVDARQGEDGETTEGIFDGETVGSGFTGHLLPGKRATATYGFDAGRGARTLDVEVSLNDFETEPAQWSLTL